MYVDDPYTCDDLDRIFAALAARPLATLVAHGPTPLVTHVPVLGHRTADSRGTLSGHVPAADPIAEAIRLGHPMLAIFLGPAVYVSPRHYADRGLPTYNFVAIHAAGVPTPIDDPSEVRAHLRELSETHEGDHPQPWRADLEDERTILELLPHLQAFRMPISALQAKFKLSQNRSERDRLAVIAALREFPSSDGQDIADLMADLYDDRGRLPS